MKKLSFFIVIYIYFLPFQKIYAESLSINVPHEKKIHDNFTNNTNPLLADKKFDNWIFPGSLLIGAQKRSGADSDSFADNIGGALIMRHKPDGYLDLGCVHSTGATEKNVFFMRAPIASNDNTKDGISTYKTLDTAVSCDMSELLPATIIAKADSFTKNTVTLSKPLNLDQISKLHYGMYIVTNIIRKSIYQNGPSIHTELDSPNFYVSTLSGWSSDGTTLTVVGWTVPGGGRSTIGTPTTAKKIDGTYTNIDDRWGSTTYTVPMVFIGASTQIEGQNIFALYDPKSIKNSFDHWFTGSEYDLEYDGKDGDAHVVGTSYNFTGSGNPDSTSAAIIINGRIPYGIINQIPCSGIEVSGYEFTANGCGGQLGPTVSSRSMMFKSQNYTDRFLGFTGDIVSLQSYLQRDISVSKRIGGFSNSSLHLGGFLNNSQTDTSSTTGSQIADITFGYQGSKNGIALCPGNTDSSGEYNYCMRLDNYGNLLIPQKGKIIMQHDVTDSDSPYIYANGPTNIKLETMAGNGVVLSTYRVSASLIDTSSSIISGGNIKTSKAGGKLMLTPERGNIIPFLYASNKYNVHFLNQSGDKVFLNTHGVKSYAVSASGSLIIPFGTPKSSTSPCMPGQMQMDSNYIYSCISSNVWHRTSNGDTW